MSKPHEEPTSQARDPESDASVNWADKRIFTTGEAAEVCKVSQQTIIRCFDSGRLTGFRVPGSKVRRIPRDELLRFMKANNIPTTILDAGKKRILVDDDDAQILDLFQDILTRDGRFEVQTASNGYDAGMLTEQFRPHLMILDYLLPDVNGNIVCQRVRNSSQLRHTKILFVSGVIKPDEVQALKKAGADDFIKKPFNVGELLRRIEELLELEAGAPKPAGATSS